MSEALTSLDALAAEANENHKLAESTAGRAIDFARKAGAALLEAKEQIKHGEWQAWLKSHFTGSYRLAASYMQVSSNMQTSAHLEPKSINEALRMIAGDSDDEPEPEEQDAAEEAEEEEDPPAGATPSNPAARSVTVEVVEEEGEDEPAEKEDAPEPEPEDEEEVAKDSEKLSLLKSTWMEASKKDKTAFAAWLNKNWEF